MDDLKPRINALTLQHKKLSDSITGFKLTLDPNVIFRKASDLTTDFLKHDDLKDNIHVQTQVRDRFTKEIQTDILHRLAHTSTELKQVDTQLKELVTLYTRNLFL